MAIQPEILLHEKGLSFGTEGLDPGWPRSRPANRNRLFRSLSIHALNKRLFNTYYVPDTRSDASSWVESKRPHAESSVFTPRLQTSKEKIIISGTWQVLRNYVKWNGSKMTLCYCDKILTLHDISLKCVNHKMVTNIFTTVESWYMYKYKVDFEVLLKIKTIIIVLRWWRHHLKCK